MAISAWLVLFTHIQTRKLCELIRIDFIGFFKRFIYGNTYIYNLIDYFLKYIYFYLIISTGTNNVIFLFNHYLQDNFKPYII